MKFPSTTSTFAWLAAAVSCAAVMLFVITSIFTPETSLAATTPQRLLPETNPATLKFEPLNTSRDNLIQLAFLLDTSSSMDGLIDQAKSRLWSILNEIIAARRDGQAPNVQVALYEYGNDQLEASKGYIRQVVSLTTDVDEISEKLFALSTNGGQEYCGAVIQQSLDQLEWSRDQDAIKLIYIAGNEGFDQGSVNPYRAINDGRETGVVVNTIFCGPAETGRELGWYSGAMKGAGEYFHIDQNQAVVYLSSPYDDRIEAANNRLNSTYIPLGHQGRTAIQKQKTQDSNAGTYSKANLASRAKYKSSANYNNASWDLVDAYDKDKKVILRTAALPDSLQQLSETELKSRIAEKKAERNSLQSEIKELNKMRDQHIAEEKKKSAVAETNTLGEKIKKSVKQRLIEKGYEVEN